MTTVASPSSDSCYGDLDRLQSASSHYLQTLALLPLAKWSGSANETELALFSPLTTCCASSLPPRRKKISALNGSTDQPPSPTRIHPRPTVSVFPGAGAMVPEATAGGGPSLNAAPHPSRASRRQWTGKRCDAKKQHRRRAKWKTVALLMSVATLFLLSACAYLGAQNLNKEEQHRYLNITDNTDNGPRNILWPEAKSLPNTIVSTGAYPTQYHLGQNVSSVVKPHGFWTVQFYFPERLNVGFFVGYEAGAVIGVYGRRGLPPSHTLFDFFRTEHGRQTTFQDSERIRKSRETSALDRLFVFVLEFENLFTSGLWFVSIYNDDSQSRNISLYATTREFAGDPSCLPVCSASASASGVCVGSDCRCFQGLSAAASCLQRRCSTMCSEHGFYSSGRCQCHSGWTGSNCDQPTGGCEELDCGGHGICVNGLCTCSPGYIGINCTEELCLTSCLHGRCLGERCLCDAAWSGTACDTLRCDSRCQLHGKCHNGTCVCNVGWNGKYCSIEGCPMVCGAHGRCEIDDQFQWSCNCSTGWKGLGCEVSIEMSCSDGVDDDADTLIDCLDPDCCLSVSCRDKGLCQTVPNPQEILLRKQPPSNMASFFERVSFLIEESSIQRSATREAFNPSRASVVRGEVVSRHNIPILGVKVTVPEEPMFGFTLTRELGSFDLLVNGGGSVTLLFQRPPFLSKNISLLVQWNRIIALDPVVLLLYGHYGDDYDVTDDANDACSADDNANDMEPLVSSASLRIAAEADENCQSCSAILTKSRALQENLSTPGVSFHLTYRSSDALGYRLTAYFRLTEEWVPAGLAFVHLRIYLEGKIFQKIFEADRYLRYTFPWDRLNAYNQRVYGTAEATVFVGYEFKNCGKTHWKIQTVVLSGCAIASSRIGDWSISIHHTYNFLQGILHKGDGTDVHLRSLPIKPSTALGRGRGARRIDCRDCRGRAKEVGLLAPVALAAAPDGTLFIGDYNFVRQLTPNQHEVNTVLQLKISEVPYKYFMAVSPVDGHLFISDYQRLQVIRVRAYSHSSVNPKDLVDNYEVYAGTGDQCMPGDPNQCGDGGLAIHAKMLYPKGIAINKDGELFVSDGVSVRKIGKDGKLETVLGSRSVPLQWKLPPCRGSIQASEVVLQWPTALAVNPHDGSLYILDDKVLLRLTPDGQVIVIFGHPVHCRNPESASPERLHLDQPQHFTISHNGDIYVVDGGTTGRETSIWVFTTDGRAFPISGSSNRRCSCWKRVCDCSEEFRGTTVLNATLKAVAEVAITPDGTVHLADAGQLRILSLIPDLPLPDKSNHYEIRDLEHGEVYTFNRFGQHLATRNLHTHQQMYNFTYSSNSYHGKVTKITDGYGNVTLIQQDYRLQAKELTLPNGRKCKITLDYMGRLQSFQDTRNRTTNFTYVGNTGLVKTKRVGSERIFEYQYDAYGQIQSVVLPSSECVGIEDGGSRSTLVLDSDILDTVKLDVNGESGDDIHSEDYLDSF